MTVPAWQKREMERQKLLETMRERMYEKFLNPVDEKDLEEGDFLYALAAIILHHLELDGNTHKGGDKRDKAHGTLVRRGHFEAHMFFEEFIWGKIFSFGRTPEEKLALLSDFFERELVPFMLVPFRQALSTQEMFSPQRIYLAERTDEVSLEDPDKEEADSHPSAIDGEGE